MAGEAGRLRLREHGVVEAQCGLLMLRPSRWRDAPEGQTCDGCVAIEAVRAATRARQRPGLGRGRCPNDGQA
ncbi:MAG: hypothetical protein ACRDSR_11140 [Pseudonocardiaceae bacterium]